MDAEGYIVMDSRLSGDEYDGDFEDIDFVGIQNEGKEDVVKEVDELDVLSMEIDVCDKGDTCESTPNSVKNIESDEDDISTKEDVDLSLEKKESEEISMDVDESGGDLEPSGCDILEQSICDSERDKTNSFINVGSTNLEKDLNDTRESENFVTKKNSDDNSKANEKDSKSKESEEHDSELENKGDDICEEGKREVSNKCDEMNVMVSDEQEKNKNGKLTWIEEGENANCSNLKPERNPESGIDNYAKECEVENFLNNHCAEDASRKSPYNFNEMCSEVMKDSCRDQMEVFNDCVKSKLNESEKSKKENYDITEDCKQGKSENLDDKKTAIAVIEDSKSDENGMLKVLKKVGNKLENFEAENCIVLDDNNIEEIIKNNSNKKSIEVKESERIASDDVLSVKKPLKSVNRKNLDIICVDLKTDDDVLICDDPNRKPRKQCCNLECESRNTLTNAPVAVLTHFGIKYVKGKSQKVCKQCFEMAVSHQEHLAYVLMEHKPLLKEEFPIRADIALIDDSDEEGSDEETPLGEDILLDVDDKLMEVIDSSMENYDLDFQVRESDAILQETYKNLKDEFLKTDDAFDKLQAEIDQLRSKLYLGFAPKIKELPFLDIIDTPDSNLSPEKRNKGSSNVVYISPSKRFHCSNLDSPRRSSLGVATKKVTQVQRNVFPGLSQIETQEVVALEQVQQVRPVLPPLGPLSRPKSNIHDVLYVMKNGYYGMWARAKVLEVLTRQDITNPSKLESQFKIKFESRKSSMVKTVTGKQVAYPSPSPVRLPVGTRVIALFRDEWAKECYYAGIIAEPPKSMNKYRYLVFFDDGYAQYVCHEKILLVCESSRNVWDDIHPDSRDFVRNYLEQFPERPMLKLQRGQIVKTEWNGKWWIARVVEVDGSLVKMHFDADGRTELIYRGSTRLGPLYSELAHAAARKNMGSFSRHRSLGISSLKRRNMPYVEYTRSDLDENKLEDSGDMNRSLEKTMPSRAVAKKSTSKRTDSAREQLEALILSSDRDIQSGHVESIYINPSYKPKMFIPHQCGSHCVEGINYDASQIKHYNPLVLPLLHGWQRHITRCKAKKIVIYRSPCGRRLRNMEELHRFLRVTQSNLPVDLFDYDSWVHCFSEFVMRTGFINIKDLSYGHENVPVPCVNNVDHSKPEYVKYSTVRLPMEGVNVNTEPQFLVCCDCTDDCQNKEKCACWQLTVQGTAYGSGGKVDTSVGYWYKRLREPVMTGIYECNARCKCSSTCLNRVAQHPLQLRLQVFKTENRGWGIRCLNDVPHGAFICIYAGRLLTEQGANECVLVKGGKNYGDEYLAELDYIEVVERLKDGYESDVVEDEDAPFSSNKEEKIKKSKALSDEEEEEEGENSHDAHDSDYELDSRHHNIKVVPLEESTIRTRLRNRKARNSSIDSEEKEGGRDESMTEKGHKKSDERKGSILSSDDASSLITLSDDEDDEQREREPSRFAAMSGPKKETEKKVSYKSVREYYGDDEFCYIMDAKNDGNIGRYLNHSCSPNVFVQNVFVDTHDLRFPWVAFFALTYISAGTELTWDYNYDVGSVPGKVLHCYCGSSECRGRLL